MLAQHVSSELRMHLWPLRSQTDRNTPSQMKIYFGKSGSNGFFRYNGFITDFCFLPVFDIFEEEKNLDAINFMECSGGQPQWDKIMS